MSPSGVVVELQYCWSGEPGDEAATVAAAAAAAVEPPISRLAGVMMVLLLLLLLLLLALLLLVVLVVIEAAAAAFDELAALADDVAEVEVAECVEPAGVATLLPLGICIDSHL